MILTHSHWSHPLPSEAPGIMEEREASHSLPGPVQIPGPESTSIIKCLLFNATKFGVVCNTAVMTGTIVPGITCKSEVMIR